MAPNISHMFFADYSYIFCKGNMEMATHVLNMLSVFERASGQKINAEKSSVFSSKNMTQAVNNELCQVLQYQEANDGSLYLGLPNIIGRNKTIIFGYLKERLKDRVQGWDKQILSK